MRIAPLSAALRHVFLLAPAAPTARAIEPYPCRNGFFPEAAGAIRAALVVDGAANASSSRTAKWA